MRFNNSRATASPRNGETPTETLPIKEPQSMNSSGGLLAQNLLGSSALGSNARSWSLGLGIELDQIFSAAVGSQPSGCNDSSQTPIDGSQGLKPSTSMQQQQQQQQQQEQHHELSMPPPPPPVNELLSTLNLLAIEGNTTGPKKSKGKGVAPCTRTDRIVNASSSSNFAVNRDTSQPNRSIDGQRFSRSMSMVITGGLETSYDQCTPRSPSIASSINTTRSVRMRDHARIFPKRLRTSTGSLREAYAGRHTPVLNSGCSGGWASPAMSIHSGRAGLPSAPIPGSGPSTPRVPVSRGEAGYMGKQTYIAFNKSAPRTVSTGHIASFTNTSSNLSRHSSQNDIHLSGRGSVTGGTQGFGSMDSMPSSPRSPSVYRAHSSGFRHDDIESMHLSGCASNNVNGPVLPMTREAAAMEENRLDQELRALRRRSMCNDIYRSQSVGCLSTGTKSTSCQSFDASVPDYGNPSESKHSKKRLMSSPSIRSLRSFMSPIIGGGQFTSNSNENGNCNVGKHSSQPFSGPASNLGSPNLSSGLSTSNSLYQQQSYSQAHSRGERKSGFRSVFSTPNLTSIRARRASLRVKSTLSSLAVSSISSSSGTTTSPTSSTVSDLFLSPPPVLPLVEGQDQTESALDVPGNTAVMSADELIQTELAAIEMEKFEREQATAAATAAAVASAASPVETTMEEVQPQDGLLDPMGSRPPDGRSRASSVMSTDTDASSAASSVTSSTPSGKHPLSRPSIQPHPPHLQHHLPYQSQSPPQHPSMQRQLGQRGRGDDIASISSVRSKRSIPFGQLKKMLTKPFSFSNPLKDHHRSSSSSSSSITTSTITAKLPSISSSSQSTMHTQHPQHDDNRPVRFPTKDDGKFQWDYRRHVNPLHDDS